MKKISNVVSLTCLSLLLSGCPAEQKINRAQISTAEEFINMILETKPSTVEIMNDIDLEGATMILGKRNSHHVDIVGNGHTISNAVIESKYNASMFGNIEGVIDGLVFDNIKVTGSNTAIVASNSTAKLKNITVNETCEVDDEYASNAAGIVAISKGSEVSDCVNNAKVTGYDCVGGIAGLSNSTISHCTNNGLIVTTNNYTSEVGGIVGCYERDKNSSYISDCINNGRINAGCSDNVGGLVGLFKSVIKDPSETDTPTAIRNSSNYGYVTGKDKVGGILGELKADGYYNTNKVDVVECYNHANVTGQKYVGGIVGYAIGKDTGSDPQSVNINFCENAFENESCVIEGEYYVGGIAGVASSISRCNNRADVRLTLSEDTEPIDGSKRPFSNQFALGGIVGATLENMQSYISECTNLGAVKGYVKDDTEIRYGTSVGGIVGLTYGGEYSKLNNYNEINAYQCVGGIIGSLYPYFKSSVHLAKSFGDMTVSGYSGGLCGVFLPSSEKHFKANFTYCQVDIATVTALGANFGGYAGAFMSSDPLDVFTYESMEIDFSTSTYSYLIPSTSTNEQMKPTVWVNSLHEGKYGIKVSQSSTNDASCTQIGVI